jgi:hypothetical protein
MMRATWMRVEDPLPGTTAWTKCVACGGAVPLAARGDVVVAMVVAESEFLGLVGACCLPDATRAELARLNETDGVRR